MSLVATGTAVGDLTRFVNSLTALNGRRPQTRTRHKSPLKPVTHKERDVSVWVHKGFIDVPRFEIPLDVRELERMTPMQYLIRYCVVTSRVKKSLYYKQYMKHREPKVDGLESLEKAKKAVRDVCTIVVSQRAHGPTESLLNYYFHTILCFEPNENVIIKFKQFIGMCALAERIFNPNYMKTWQANDKKLHEDHKVYKILLEQEKQLEEKKQRRMREAEIEAQKRQQAIEQLAVKNINKAKSDDLEAEIREQEREETILDNTPSELQLIKQTSSHRKQLENKASVSKILEVETHPDKCVKELMERIDFHCLRWKLEGIKLSKAMERILKIVENL